MASQLYLITGNDAEAIAAKGRELLRTLCGDKPDAFALDTIREGDEVTPADAVNLTAQAVRTPSFFGGKTVWLKNFSAFKEEKKQGAPGSVAKGLERLAELIEAGLPSDITLVLSGPEVDKRKRLFKCCSAAGEVILFDKPDAKQRDWQAAMGRLLQERAAAKKLRLTPEARDHLVAILGTETGGIDSELEKLACYLDGQTTVDGATAELLCHGDGQTVSWAINDLLGRRNLGSALSCLDAVLAAEKTPDSAVFGLVWQISGLFRQLLQMRVLMAKFKLRAGPAVGNWLRGLAAEEKTRLAESGFEVANFHPYRGQLLAESAANYSGDELIDAVIRLRDVSFHCVTSGADNRVALESALVRICSRRNG